MPLHKHFRGTDPNGFGRSFLHSWLCGVGTWLNPQLPGNDFFVWVRARSKLKLEQRIADFEHGPRPIHYGDTESDEYFKSFEPSAPLLSAPAVFDDDYNVRVVDSVDGPTIAAVIAFVCPNNKLSLASARAFSERMCAHIHQGIGVVVIDIVNDMKATWLPFLARSLGFSDGMASMRDAEMCALSLRPRFRDGQGSVEIWCERLADKQTMPVLPLAVKAGVFLKIDLEQTYEDTFDRAGYRKRPYLYD